VHERAGDRLCVGAGAFECPLDARLQRSPGDPFAIAPDEQRGPSRPLGQGRGCGVGLSLYRAREADRAAVEVCLDHGEQFGLDGHAAFFAAFAFDVDDGGPVVGGADIADIGSLEFLGAQAGKQPGQY
jgi:hypothetical protein